MLSIPTLGVSRVQRQLDRCHGKIQNYRIVLGIDVAIAIGIPKAAAIVTVADIVVEVVVPAFTTKFPIECVGNRRNQLVETGVLLRKRLFLSILPRNKDAVVAANTATGVFLVVVYYWR